MAQDPVSVVRKLMYRRLRITLTDGRVLFGDFQCFDKQGMIILGNTYEQVTTAQGKVEERLMGIVLIPKAHQFKVELEGTIEEKLRYASIADEITR